MTAAVHVRDLVKRYGDLAAVDGVSLEVEHGEIVGLLGPNGAGKTTTLECILGLRTPDSGVIGIEGLDSLRQTAAARARVGAVLQTTTLQDRITPREALRLFAALHGRPRTRAEALLEEFSLADKAGAAFETLSGGQRQRLALAIAFVHEPRVVVLDEPTAGLDPAARRDLHERIQRLRAGGCAVLLSTHDMAEAQRLCDRLAIIAGGRILATGTPEGLIAQSGAMARVRLRTVPPLEPAHVATLAGVESCTSTDGTLVLHTRDTRRTLAAVAQVLAQETREVCEMHVEPPTLEDAFLRLTGKSLAAAAAER